MRRLLVLVVACATPHARPPEPADEWNPPEPPLGYPLAPTFPDATAGSVWIAGDIEEPVFVPYTQTLTFRTAVTIAGGARVTRKTATLERTERGELHRYEVPARAIVEGRLPDLRLAPGDSIIMHEDLCDGWATCD